MGIPVKQSWPTDTAMTCGTPISSKSTDTLSDTVSIIPWGIMSNRKKWENEKELVGNTSDMGKLQGNCYYVFKIWE